MTSKSHLASWQPYNSISKRKRKSKQQENNKSAFGSDALDYSGRNEIRRRPGQEASLVSPCSNLRFFRSKCIVLKKVFVTLLGLFRRPSVIRRPGNCAPLAPLVTPVRSVVLVYPTTRTLIS